LKTNSWDKGDDLTNKFGESTMSEAAEDQAKANGKWRLIVLLLAVVAALVLAKVFGLGERMGELRGWIESLGAWGPVVFVLLYIVAVVAMLPGSALTLAAGALFGSVVGVAVVSVGATLGAGAAFLVSRYFARDAAANWLGKNEKFRQLDQLTERHGAIIVALTRLVPIFPFNLLNYGFGLIANVHPPDWKNPEPAPRYNLVVIGAGTAGLVTAAGAAGLGARVALIERNLMGGDCLNVGCVPSKSVIRSSRVCAEIREARNFGIDVPAGVTADFAAVMERMRRIRSGISRHDSAHRFTDLGVDVFLGDAKFAGPDTVEVAGKTLRFKKAVLATGARAIAPPIDGLSEASYLTNETVFNLTELPRRLLVIGGGPIGCELAQAFCRLSSEVTIVEIGKQFLSREDREAAEILARSLERDGVQIRLSASVKRVVSDGLAKVVDLESGRRQETITVDEILVGAGRAPNVEGLNLEAVGVEYDRKKGVVVNDHLQTTNPRIYAAGDVCLQYKFTHTADDAARILIQNALFLGRKKLSALTVPWCTYTDPEIAHVGLYEHEANERGIALETFQVPLSGIDRAIADGEEEGFVKIHVKKGSDQILGATIVARHAGEMISEITLAMVGNVGLGTIASVIHPYPTLAEAIKRCATCQAEMEARQRLRVILRRIRDNGQVSAEFQEQLRERLRLEAIAEKTSGARRMLVFLRLFARRHR
jgi:pyruvate/2-oxoglutarate dehydrogenase complex dihydrolipoamide dehydrogenase (E3) component